jgi:hypothetical protein
MNKTKKFLFYSSFMVYFSCAIYPKGYPGLSGKESRGFSL